MKHRRGLGVVALVMTNWPDLLWRNDDELLRLGNNNGHRVVGREKLVGVDLTVASH
jgi:hypothetical protein